MRIRFKKQIKYICRGFSLIFISLFALLFLVIGMFFIDSGRKILLSAVTRYFQSQNTVIDIRGLDCKITKIEELLIKTPDGTELIFSNVSLKRPQSKMLFPDALKSSINVDKFIFNEIASKNETKEKINTKEKLKKSLPLLRILKMFIADLSLVKGILNICGKTYTLDNFQYKSESNNDYLYCKINNNYIFDIFCRWNLLECVESKIKFENIMNFNGELHIQNHEKEISEYRFYAINKDIRFEAIGDYQDPMTDIDIKDAYIEYKNQMYPLKGKLYLQDRKTHLTANLDLNNFIADLPMEIKKNFEDVSAVFDINYDFKENSKNIIDIKLKKSDKNIGDIKCNLQNNIINASGKIDWINIYGFQTKKISCKYSGLQDLNLKIEGDEFCLTSDIKINKKISIENLKLGSESCGFLQLAKPCILDKDSEYCFNFKFDRLAFWNKIAPISGDAIGTVSYKKGVLISRFNGRSLLFENNKLKDFSCNINGKNIDISSKQAFILNSKCQNLNFKIDNEKIKITTVINDDLSMNAAGKISASYKKISFENFTINSKEYACSTKNFDVDLEKNNCKILCDISNKKTKKKGSVHITKDKSDIDIKLNSFQTSIVSKICNCWIPNCNLNGTINLKPSVGNNTLIGDGNLSIYGLIAKANTLDASFKLMNTGIKLNVTLKNNKDLFNGDFLVPICVANNGAIIKNLHATTLNCHIYGNTQIEHLLELSDKTDARGLLNCNLKISGSFANPVLSGNAKLQKAYFVIDDVFLRNGSISLSCDRNKILISQAEFIDAQKKKLNISGNGVFYFNGIAPNIKTNLHLNFNNFTLFDSDSMKISILGDGNITGDINNLLISGDVDVTKCKIQKFDSGDIEKNNDIIVENERNIEIQLVKEKKQEDFCKYNVNMRCPKINVSGSIFEIILSGNLKLLTYEKASTLVGSLKLLSGKLDLFGKRLKITKGNIEFLEKYPFDPIAYFMCKRNLGEMAVYLEMSNNPEKGASFNLYSAPSYTQDVILSNMLFGKELKYLSVSEAAQLANAITSFKRKGYIFSILNTFQKLGLIDTLSFAGSEKKANSLYSDEQNPSKQNNLNVSAGKYIHDNIYISVNKKSDNTTSFDVDLSLTPKMSIKANSNGEAGVSWKYRY